MVDLICAFSLGVVAAEFPSVRVPILTILPIAGAILGSSRKSLLNWMFKEKVASEVPTLPKLPVFKKPQVVLSNVQDLHIADIFPPDTVLPENPNVVKPKVQNPWKVDAPALVPALAPLAPENDDADSESNLFVGHKIVPNPWTVLSPETPVEVPEDEEKETEDLEEHESQGINEVEEGEIVEDTEKTHDE